MKKNKLRLLFTAECNRNCAGCCNKDWDLTELPIMDRIDYDEIIITGGEPMLFPKQLRRLLTALRELTDAKLILYTAKPNIDLAMLLDSNLLDSVTLTLHAQKDATTFNSFDSLLNEFDIAKGKKLRLNIFSGIDCDFIDTDRWVVKNNIEWIEDCPLPQDEEFKRLKD